MEYSRNIQKHLRSKLNEEKYNPWKFLPIEKLISLSRTPNSGIIITNKITKKIPETTTPDKSLRNIYEGTTTFRFGSNIENNPFRKPNGSSQPVVPTFPMWTSTDDTFYYNFIKNKNKGPAKRKVTFGQTLITQLPSILSG